MLLIIVALPHEARADETTAFELFKQGNAALEDNRIPEACAKFKEAYALDPNGAIGRRLAECDAQEGKLATAHARLTKARAQAATAGFDDLVAEIDEQLAAIEPLIPRLRVDVPEGIEGLTVFVDDVALDAASHNQPLRHDVGTVTIRTEAPNHRTFVEQVTLAKSQNETVKVELVAFARITVRVPVALAAEAGLVVTLDGEPLARERWGVAIDVDAGAHLVTATTPGEPPWRAQRELAPGEEAAIDVALTTPAPKTTRPLPVPSSSSPWAPIGWVALAVGGAGAVIWGVAGGVAITRKADLDCTGEVCDASQDAIDDAATAAHVSTAGVIVTGVGAAVGVLALVMGFSDDDADTALTPTGLRIRF